MTAELLERAPLVMKSYPLRTVGELDDRLLFGHIEHVAVWLVYVGLAGRFCLVRGTAQWHELGDVGWQPVGAAHVVRAARRVLGKEHDRRRYEPLRNTYTAVGATAKERQLSDRQRAMLDGLLGHSLQTERLLRAMGRVAAVDRPPARGWRGPKRVRANERRFRCAICPMESTPAGIGLHHRYSGHVGRVELS